MRPTAEQIFNSNRLLRSGKAVVLHFVQALRGGGAQTLVRELVPRLRNRGVDARVLCAYGSSQLTEAEEAAWSGIVYSETRVGVPRIRYISNLRRILRLVRPALINTHTHSGSVWGRASAVLAGVPAIVHTEHDSVESLPFIERVTVGLLNLRTEAIVAFSERSAALVRRREKIQRPIVIPNGIQIRPAPTGNQRLSARQKLGANGDSVIIGVIASLESYKNPTLALDSIARLSDEARRCVRLEFFGDGSLRVDLAARANELHIGELVRFHGFRGDLTDLLPGLDIVLSTSDREMMPISFLEAMNSALPIIGTPNGGTLDLVKNGETGIVLKAWDKDEVAAAIEWAVMHPQWRIRAGDAAYRRVCENFNIESVADQYLSLYGDILSSKASRGW